MPQRSQAVKDLIAKIQDKDDNVRAAAWTGAGPLGAEAVDPLADVMAAGDLEVARAAKRGLWKIVRHVGRPGADSEKRAVVARLCQLLGPDQPLAVRREAIWMLSEIGDSTAVEAIRSIPGILDDEELLEDARCAVQRIPGEAAVWTLQDGFDFASEDAKYAFAESLRDRGVKVDGYPSKKLEPTRQTKVKPVE